jgi:hypothetical protein
MNYGTEAKATLVPMYLKASTPDLLRESMLLNNLTLKKEIKYQDIQFVDGSWYAWFYEEVDVFKKLSTKKAK